jgi:DNA processing protein
LSDGDPGYPRAMRAAAVLRQPGGERGRTLHLRGYLPPLAALAVVGTRKPTHQGCKLASALVRTAADFGLAIWSGGAYGIDACVHRAALAHGAPTVVVTAGGLDSCYPAEHEALYRAIVARGGALVSLEADGEPRQRWHFVRRNYVLAALNVATLVIEAGVKSGARHAARAARACGRPLLVVPGAPWSATGAGCAHELARGAIAIAEPRDLQRSLRTILAATRSDETETQSATNAPERAEPMAPPTAEEEVVFGRLLAALEAGPCHVDALCQALAAPPQLVACALVELVIRRRVVEVAPGSYARAGSDGTR